MWHEWWDSFCWAITARYGLPTRFGLWIFVRVQKTGIPVAGLPLGIAISLSFHQYSYHGSYMVHGIWYITPLASQYKQRIFDPSRGYTPQEVCSKQQNVLNSHMCSNFRPTEYFRYTSNWWDQHGGSKPWSCLNQAQQWHIHHAKQATDLRANSYI